MSNNCSEIVDSFHKYSLLLLLFFQDLKKSSIVERAKAFLRGNQLNQVQSVKAEHHHTPVAGIGSQQLSGGDIFKLQKSQSVLSKNSSAVIKVVPSLRSAFIARNAAKPGSKVLLFDSTTSNTKAAKNLSAATITNSVSFNTKPNKTASATHRLVAGGSRKKLAAKSAETVPTIPPNKNKFRNLSPVRKHLAAKLPISRRAAILQQNKFPVHQENSNVINAQGAASEAIARRFCGFPVDDKLKTATKATSHNGGIKPTSFNSSALKSKARTKGASYIPVPTKQRRSAQQLQIQNIFPSNNIRSTAGRHRHVANSAASPTAAPSLPTSAFTASSTYYSTSAPASAAVDSAADRKDSADFVTFQEDPIHIRCYSPIPAPSPTYNYKLPTCIYNKESSTSRTISFVDFANKIMEQNDRKKKEKQEDERAGALPSTLNTAGENNSPDSNANNEQAIEQAIEQETAATTSTALLPTPTTVSNASTASAAAARKRVNLASLKHQHTFQQFYSNKNSQIKMADANEHRHFFEIWQLQTF